MDTLVKPIHISFGDWESSAFGFGYGSGKEHTLAALQKFLTLCKKKTGEGYENLLDPIYAYDYKELEEQLTPPVAWLLINILGRVGIITYGTSPRYAWLTKSGARLREFVLSHTVEALVDFTALEASGDCSNNICNCEPDGYLKGAICQNPFWVD